MPATQVRTVTGLNHVFVNTTDPAPKHVVQVFEGQALPSNLKEGELDRLEGLGAFREHPRDVRNRAIQVIAGQQGPGLPTPQADVDAMLRALDKATE